MSDLSAFFDVSRLARKSLAADIARLGGATEALWVEVRDRVALWQRLGWWKPRPQTEAEAMRIIDDYETESRER